MRWGRARCARPRRAVAAQRIGRTRSIVRTAHVPPAELGRVVAARRPPPTKRRSATDPANRCGALERNPSLQGMATRLARMAPGSASVTEAGGGVELPAVVALVALRPARPRRADATGRQGWTCAGSLRRSARRDGSQREPFHLQCGGCFFSLTARLRPARRSSRRDRGSASSYRAVAGRG